MPRFVQSVRSRTHPRNLYIVSSDSKEILIMKHVFVINPAAGKGKKQKDFAEQIKNICTELGADFEIHFTTAVGQATEFVKQKCLSYPTSKMRFYA